MTVHATTPARSRGLLSDIGQRMTRIFTRLVENSANGRAARKARRLWAMSDAELAAIGIPRNQILYRTFGPGIGL